jgi:uncharacterized membrane protein YjgN (DUF898 family)
MDTQAQYTPFEFRGNAKEFFKIWIVNIALSVITLGIYSAWAKVRTNRYIYGNTYLNSSNFEFNANAKKILYGRLIVISFYAIFLFATDVIYSNTLALIVLILFLLLLPWLIRQAISFRLKSASYRNIHFKYRGKIREFYKLAFYLILFFILALSPAIILGAFKEYMNKDFMGLLTFVFIIIFWIVIIPSLYKNFKSLIINNSYYGKARFNFNATKKDAIKLFFKMGIITFIASIVIGLITTLLSVFLHFLVNTIQINSNNLAIKQTLFSLGAMILYLVTIGLYKGISDGYLSNFVRDNTTLEECKFLGTIKPIKLGFISVTNILATIFTLGLAYPWAKMRYLKYKASNTFFMCEDYDKFMGDGKESSSTIGEETMDFFDIDIGI